MKKFRVLGCGLAYLLLAGISCWATEQSLHLLLPAGWPEILVWGITIAFFVVASIGTWLITSTLASSWAFVENRKLRIFGGSLLVIFFWLLMSMPTNTHTFFYKDKIGSVITKDIEITNKYLTQIIDKGTSSSSILNSGDLRSLSSLTLDSVGVRIKDTVEAERTHIVKQFNGDEPPYRRGNGEKIGDHLRNINTILNSTLIQYLPYNSTDVSILDKYQVDISRALFNALRTHTINPQAVEDARNIRSRLMTLKDDIQELNSTGDLSESEIKQCETELRAGYNIISTNKQFIDFDDQSDDSEVYTKENAETRTKRLASVIDVFFVDFMQGKYPGSFWYYVILSILIDIAAFIFFDIALHKDNNY